MISTTLDWIAIEEQEPPKGEGALLFCMARDVAGQPIDPATIGKVFGQVADFWPNDYGERGSWVVYTDRPSEPRLHFKPTHWARVTWPTGRGGGAVPPGPAAFLPQAGRPPEAGQVPRPGTSTPGAHSARIEELEAKVARLLRQVELLSERSDAQARAIEALERWKALRTRSGQ
jgi:hypothetical protein